MATFVDEYSKWATGAEAPANGNATGLPLRIAIVEAARLPIIHP